MERKKYNKAEAIEASKEFLKEVNKIEDKYGITFNTDESIFLSFKKEKPRKNENHFDHVEIGWIGDGSPIRVTEVVKDDEFYRKEALAKLSPEERKLLGL